MDHKGTHKGSQRMKRGTFLLCAALLTQLADLQAAEAPQPAGKPNFVFFLTDDQPYIGMSCTGNPVLKTPEHGPVGGGGRAVRKSVCDHRHLLLQPGQHLYRPAHAPARHRGFSEATLRRAMAANLPGPTAAGPATALPSWVNIAIGSPEVNKELSLPEEQFDLWYGFPQGIAFKQVVDGKERYLTTVMTEKAMQFLKETQEGPTILPDHGAQRTAWAAGLFRPGISRPICKRHHSAAGKPDTPVLRCPAGTGAQGPQRKPAVVG